MTPTCVESGGDVVLLDSLAPCGSHEPLRDQAALERTLTLPPRSGQH